MSLTNCWDCGPGFAFWIVTAFVVSVAPIGAFVLRRHIAAATGGWRIAGKALQVLAVLSTPFAGLLMLAIIAKLID